MYIIVIEWAFVSPQIIKRETYDEINERFIELKTRNIDRQTHFKRMTMYDFTDNIEIKSYVGNY